MQISDQKCLRSSHFDGIKKKSHYCIWHICPPAQQNRPKIWLKWSTLAYTFYMVSSFINIKALNQPYILSMDYKWSVLFLECVNTPHFHFWKYAEFVNVKQLINWLRYGNVPFQLLFACYTLSFCDRNLCTRAIIKLHFRHNAQWKHCQNVFVCVCVLMRVCWLLLVVRVEFR